MKKYGWLLFPLLLLAAVAHGQVQVQCPFPSQTDTAGCDIHITYGAPPPPPPIICGPPLQSSGDGKICVCAVPNTWSNGACIAPPPAPTITATPMAANFPAVLKTDSAVQFIILNNPTGTAPALSFTLTGTGFAYANVGNCNNTVPTPAGCKISLKYNPPDTLPHTGTLTINVGTGTSPIVVNLNGTTIPAPPVLNVKLWWSASVTTNVVGYNLYRGTVKGGPYTKINTSVIATAPTSAAPYVDATATSGTYYYVATALDSAGKESLYSNEITVIKP